MNTRTQVDELVNPAQCQACGCFAKWQMSTGSEGDYINEYYCDDCLSEMRCGVCGKKAENLYGRKCLRCSPLGFGPGEFERLMADIETAIRDADGGWEMDGNILKVLVIIGQFDWWQYFQSDGIGGIIAYDSGQNNDENRYDCVITSNGLERMARMADLTIAARAWLAKEKGCMAKLKKAVRSLAD